MSTITPTAPLAADDREALLDLVRDFATTVLAPNANDWDEHHHFPVDALRDAGEIGLGGVYAREEFGGAALSQGLLSQEGRTSRTIDAEIVNETRQIVCVGLNLLGASGVPRKGGG